MINYEMAGKKRKRPQLLSSTRPATTKSTSLSSRRTRSLVRTHHVMLKQLNSAVAKDDQQAIQDLTAKIEAAGGLSKYQDASTKGQSMDRGGDSSKVLVDWLVEAAVVTNLEKLRKPPLRMLEVGSLHVNNACARSGLFEMERIDLRSQHRLIREEDFMRRPIPSIEKLAVEGFDIVSLSLVVNFVPDMMQRGEMLKRVSNFLRRRQDISSFFFPGVFLVLPAPCITNSRYLDEERLEQIMRSLGYRKAQRKMSAKLVYYLWRHEGIGPKMEKSFKKEQIRSGASRNNFALVLQ